MHQGRGGSGNLWDLRLAHPKLPTHPCWGVTAQCLGRPSTPTSGTPTGQAAAGPGTSRQVDQGARGMTKAALGFSIKAGTGWRVPRGRSAPPLEEPVWPPRSLRLSPCRRGPVRPQWSRSPALSASLGWLKVLGAWEGEVGLDAHAAPKGLSFEDEVNEQLTRQEHTEQEPGSGVLQEAWRRHLPSPCRGAQHG